MLRDGDRAGTGARDDSFIFGTKAPGANVGGRRPPAAQVKLGGGIPAVLINLDPDHFAAGNSGFKLVEFIAAPPVVPPPATVSAVPAKVALIA